MIPYFNKNTFYYENYCSYGSRKISVIDSRGVRKSTRETLQRDIVVGRLSRGVSLHAQGAFFITRMPGKVSMKRRTKETYHGGKNEMRVL